ncbi:putative monovalent cation/H+ antiporter subunit A [Echinicola sediminis]
MAVLVYFLKLIDVVVQKEGLAFQYEWAPSIGVSMSFWVDGLSLFFALLIISFGILIVIYSYSYLKGEQFIGRFYAYLILFMGAMLGLVLSDNLISLFVFWELTSFSSYLLIGFYHYRERSRYAARQGLLVTGLGGLAMLAGFVLMGMAGDSYGIQDLLGQKDLVLNSSFLPAIVVLVLLGIVTKSAQFPFHFWLPNAMEAPTPVSAYLHSSTMVKAGIYLLFRLNPVFSHSPLWMGLLMATGAVTMVLGAVEAIRSDDLKRILAYTTISALGLFVLMVGIGSEHALKAALFYLFGHAFYKGGLFLMAGIMDQQSGTRSLGKLEAIKTSMPFTAIAAGLACASMIGLVPFLGFLGKEMVYKAAMEAEMFMVMLTVAVFLANVFFVAVAIKVFFGIFVHHSPEEKKIPVTDPSRWMVIPPLALGLGGLFFGIFPAWAMKGLFESALAGTIGEASDWDLSLWHGFNKVVWLSLGTVLAGFVLYKGREVRTEVLSKVFAFLEGLPAKGYRKSIFLLQKWAYLQTQWVQNGYLRNYIAVFVAAFILLVGYYVYQSGLFYEVGISLEFKDLFNNKLLILLLIVSTLVFIFRSKSQLMVIAAIGIIGYSIALSYTIYSAPDVAITQFLAESLGLILLILIASRLPGLDTSKLRIKGIYLVVSVLFGLLMTLVTLLGMGVEKSSKLKEYFLSNSLLEGKGANAVNVILVDFRALDTLGEISVLVIAMLGIISLLREKSVKP